MPWKKRDLEKEESVDSMMEKVEIKRNDEPNGSDIHIDLDKGQDFEEEYDDESNRPDTDTKKLVIVILVFFIALAAIFFITKYIYESNSTPEIPNYTYNGFNFVKIAGLWHTQWQNEENLYTVKLRYGPRESEDIPYYSEEEGFEPTGKVYITFDPGEGKKYVALAAAEMTLSLSTTFNSTPIPACTFADPACGGSPVITCDNTEDAVIYIKEDEYSGITTNGNCLIIQGKDEDLVRAADKVIWIWYGIIQ